QIKGAFAQYERAKIKQRTAYGRKRKALSGKLLNPGGWPGHLGPYGYKYINDTNGPRLEIIEKEAEIVKYIYDLAYTEKYGIMRIVDRLNNKQIPSPKGGIWHSSTVSRILKNEMYAGLIHFYKFRTLMTNERTESGRRKMKRETRPVSEHITMPVPAIIERDIWEAVQVFTNENRNNHRIGSFFLLKGRVKCGVCGKSCASETSGGISPFSGQRRIYYRCKGTKTGYFPKCTLPTITARTNSINQGLDDLVWNEIVKFIYNPELIKKHLNENEKADNSEEIKLKLSQLKKKISDLSKQKDELLNLRLEGLLTAEELRGRLSKLDNKKKYYEKDSYLLKQELGSIKPKIDPDAFCEYFQDRIKNAKPEIKAQVVNDLDIKVFVYSKNEFRVEWPFSITTDIIEEIDLTRHHVSLTPEIKKALDEYCQKHKITTSEAIRRAIQSVPLDEVYVKPPRGTRVDSTVLLNNGNVDIVKLLQKKHRVSATMAIEWALLMFLKP
ncbi:MAG: recombinase family protein, partial [Syntrophomonas sp.]|nr:recombinase family protein [Syntrophomonas sp.]